MDPNELLRRINEFIQNLNTGSVVDVWCEDLFDWIANGGFEPDWDEFESGTSYYKCRLISIKKGIRVGDWAYGVVQDQVVPFGEEAV